MVLKIAQVMVDKHRYRPKIAVGSFGKFPIVAVIPNNPNSNRHMWVFFELKDQEVNYDLRHLAWI